MPPPAVQFGEGAGVTDDLLKGVREHSAERCAALVAHHRTCLVPLLRLIGSALVDRDEIDGGLKVDTGARLEDKADDELHPDEAAASVAADECHETVSSSVLGRRETSAIPKPVNCFMASRVNMHF